jgi:hypothetical protein
MKQLLTILGAVLAALICAATGGYILWQFHSTAGLVGGGSLVLLGLAIALPVPFHAGVAALKENAVILVPVIVGAMKGGQRKTDPPADAPVDPYVERPAIDAPTASHPLPTPPPVAWKNGSADDGVL